MALMNSKPGLIEAVYDKHPEFKAVLRPSVKTREDKILLVFYLTMTEWLVNSAVVPSSITENRCVESFKKLGFPGNLAGACADYFANVQLSFYPAPAVSASPEDDLMGMLEVAKPASMTVDEMDEMLKPTKKKPVQQKKQKEEKKKKKQTKTSGKRKLVDDEPEEEEEEGDDEEEEEEEEEEGDEDDEEGDEEEEEEDSGLADMEEDLKFSAMTEKKAKIMAEETAFAVPSGDFKTWTR